MSDVETAVSKIVKLASELKRFAIAELEGGAYTAPSGGPGSGQGVSDPTGAKAAKPGKWIDADRLVEKLTGTAEDLEKFAARFRPRHVVGLCVTKGCRAKATHEGRCWRCWNWIRNNRHTGQTPDQQIYTETDATGEPTGRTRSLVDDWNDALPRECDCMGWACDDHEAGGCWSRPKDQRNQCDRCRKREELVRRAEREAS